MSVKPVAIHMSAFCSFANDPRLSAILLTYEVFIENGLDHCAARTTDRELEFAVRTSELEAVKYPLILHSHLMVD